MTILDLNDPDPMHELLWEFLDDLPERTRFIVMRYYGIGPGLQLNQKEIGERLKISRGRVHYIIHETRYRLRSRFRRRLKELPFATAEMIKYKEPLWLTRLNAPAPAPEPNPDLAGRIIKGFIFDLCQGSDPPSDCGMITRDHHKLFTGESAPPPEYRTLI